VQSQVLETMNAYWAILILMPMQSIASKTGFA
jgi:hypothetical protein